MNCKFAFIKMQILAALCLAACLPAGVTKNLPNESSDTPTAAILLARVRASMPKETLGIKGQIMRGTRIGRLEQAFRIEALLEWGKETPSARYLLSDTFGAPLARLTVTRPPGQAQQFLYENGKPLRPTPTPDLNQPIKGTELTWNDLSLSFLWWPGGTVVGRDNVRGRDCYVVEVPTPPQAGIIQPALTKQDSATATPATKTAASNAIASVRLWIDDRLVVLIQMEEYDASGKLIRRLSVKNFKKIGDVWMIKNMDIRRYPSRHRTQIRIEEVVSGSTSNAADPDLP